MRPSQGKNWRWWGRLSPPGSLSFGGCTTVELRFGWVPFTDTRNGRTYLRMLTSSCRVICCIWPLRRCCQARLRARPLFGSVLAQRWARSSSWCSCRLWTLGRGTQMLTTGTMLRDQFTGRERWEGNSLSPGRSALSGGSGTFP